LKQTGSSQSSATEDARHLGCETVTEQSPTVTAYHIRRLAFTGLEQFSNRYYACHTRT